MNVVYINYTVWVASQLLESVTHCGNSLGVGLVSKVQLRHISSIPRILQKRATQSKYGGRLCFGVT